MIQNLHIRQETKKGENVWSARVIMDGEIKWLTMVMDKDVTERDVQTIMERLTKVTDDTRQRTV